MGDEHLGVLRRFVKIGLPSLPKDLDVVGEHLHFAVHRHHGHAVVWKKVCGVHVGRAMGSIFLPAGICHRYCCGHPHGQYLGEMIKQARRAVWLCVLITAVAMGISASCS